MDMILTPATLSAARACSNGVAEVGHPQRGGEPASMAHFFGHPQRLSLRGRSPLRCGRGLSRNPASDAGQHGFPASAAEKRSEAAPRVSPPRPP